MSFNLLYLKYVNTPIAKDITINETIPISNPVYGKFPVAVVGSFVLFSPEFVVPLFVFPLLLLFPFSPLPLLLLLLSLF